jgi:hypothetical protein
MNTITQVRILVGKQLGISEADAITPANLSQADSIKLMDYTFKYVADHPTQFTPQQVAIAQNHVAAWGTDVPLNDTSFDWGLLASEMGNNVLKAGEDIASIGNGVLNLASMGKWLIPLVGLTLVGIVVWKVYKSSAILPSLK